MQETCVFCKIICGDIPCAPVLDTRDLLAFMDINPARPGHVLLVPKTHAATVLDIDPTCGETVFVAIQQLGRAVMQATGAEGFNVIQNNYAAAGQQVDHIHWHIIPRTAGDGLMLWPQSTYASAEAMQEMARLVESNVPK